MDCELGILSWIVFGTLADRVATMIAGTNREHGWDDADLGNFIVGIIEAFLGSLLFALLTGRETPFARKIGSFIVAVIRAVVLLVILHLVRGTRSNPLPSPFPMLVSAAVGSTPAWATAPGAPAGSSEAVGTANTEGLRR